MRADLLLLLADHLENNVKDEEFDMSDWVCGTVACAIGHTVNIPEFAQAGLVIDNDGPIYKTENPLDEEYGFDAVEICLELKQSEANYLFAKPTYYPKFATRADVVGRIREFVASRTLPSPTE